MSDQNRNALAGSIVGLVSVLAVAAFLLIGFTENAWHPGWMVFFAIPVASMLTNIIIKGNVVSAVTSIVWLLSIAAYLYLGLVYQKWLIGLLVFFAVPIAGILMKIFTLSSGENSRGCGCGNCGGTDAGQKS